MDIATLPPDQIASLVARILEDKDPATVGLRRIVRRKTAEAYDFPMRAFAVEDFAGVNKGSKALSDDEQRIIDLERQVIGLKKTAQEQARKARTAVQNAHAQGFDEGKKRGYDEGVEKAGAGHRRDLEALQASMTEFMRNLETEKNTLYASADRTMLELCRLMVKKIIAVDTHQHGEIILAVLRKALSYVAEKEKLVIRVSSRDGCGTFPSSPTNASSPEAASSSRIPAWWTAGSKPRKRSSRTLSKKRGKAFMRKKTPRKPAVDSSIKASVDVP
jgi:flagellar biosynthesis/type III secretory pathway protein FliH